MVYFSWCSLHSFIFYFFLLFFSFVRAVCIDFVSIVLCAACVWLDWTGRKCTQNAQDARTRLRRAVATFSNTEHIRLVGRQARARTHTHTLMRSCTRARFALTQSFDISTHSVCRLIWCHWFAAQLYFICLSLTFRSIVQMRNSVARVYSINHKKQDGRAVTECLWLNTHIYTDIFFSFALISI